MVQLSEVQTKKLADAIELLGLDPRIYRRLKRAGIHYVSDIFVRGGENTLNLAYIGPVLTSRIISAVAKYTNIPENEIFSKEVVRAALSFEKQPLDFLNVSSSVLALPFPAANSKLKQYSFLIDETNTNQTITEPIVSKSIIDLDDILSVLLRNERIARIIEFRANKLLTLEKISVEAGGVSRERIRQIIDEVVNKIQKKLYVLMALCDYFESKVVSIDKEPENKNITISELVDQFKLKLVDSNFCATDKALETFIALIRLLVIHESPWFQNLLEKRWGNLVDLVCFANPPIKKREVVSINLKEQKEKNRRMSYKELAQLILSKEKRPMHWSEISDQAFRMGHRETFSTTALYNTLIGSPDLFVRVDAGTYALVDWGLNQAKTYPDIIASILKSVNKPLPVDVLYRKVSEIRHIKRNTLIMTLDMHPRFYKSLENTYGLRIWLPAREKQTLLTPERLVEDSISYKRLEHASQQGYDVVNLIRLDLEPL